MAKNWRPGDTAVHWANIGRQGEVVEVALKPFGWNTPGFWTAREAAGGAVGEETWVRLRWLDRSGEDWMRAVDLRMP